MNDVKHKSVVPGFVEPALVAVAFAYLFLLLTYNLTGFTGLHVDEAWLGLVAAQIAESGIQSIHGMNTYSGTAFSALVSLLFVSDEISVFNLRLPGVLFNFLGMLILAYNAYRFEGRFGFWSFLILLLLFPGLFVLARIAWEVTAFHFFLISIKVFVVSQLAYEGRIPFYQAALFFLAGAFGTYNHFIFISDAVAFLLTTGLLSLLAIWKSKASSQGISEPQLSDALFQLNLLALLNAAGSVFYFLIKPSLGGSFFQSQSIAVFGFLAVAYLFQCAAYFLLNQRRSTVSSAVGGLIHARLLPILRDRRFKIVLGLLGLIILLRYALIYLVLFHGNISSVLPYTRIMSQEISGITSLILMASWAVIIGLFLASLNGNLSAKRDSQKVTIRNLIFHFYPLFAIAILFLFTSRNSSRHFLIACSLFIGFAPLIARDAVTLIGVRVVRKAVVVLLGICVISGNLLLWNGFKGNQDQSIIDVRYPGFRDKSAHFLKQDLLFEFMRKGAVCRFGDTSKYISFPLIFMYKSDPYACDLGRYAEVTYSRTGSRDLPHNSVVVRYSAGR